MASTGIRNIALGAARIGFDDHRVDARLLERAADELARLARAFSPDGQRIAIILGNSPLFVSALFGIGRADGCAILINPTLTGEEISAALETSGARLLVSDANFRIERAIGTLGAKPLGDVAMTPYGVLRLWSIAEHEAGGERTRQDEFVLQFTSGASGKPLAVTRLHSQCADEITRYTARVALNQADTVLCPVPLFHSFGLFVGLLAPLSAGAACILMPSFTPAHIATATKRFRPTMMLGVPVMYEVLAGAAAAADADFSACRLMLSAGAPLSLAAGTAFQSRFGKRISQLYGATETGAISVNFPTYEPFDFESVGSPLEGRSIRIVSEDGQDAPAGTSGEIAIASPATASGYVGNPEMTTERFRAGWYYTGDIGRLDREDRLYITGRRNALINVGGQKVDPVAVENVIMASGQVTECSVVGVSRPSYGDIVRAFVVLAPNGSVDVARDYCREHLAAFKIPREFVSVDRLPRGATGKVLRKYLVDAPDGLNPAAPSGRSAT